LVVNEQERGVLRGEGWLGHWIEFFLFFVFDRSLGNATKIGERPGFGEMLCRFARHAS
jgi:hypothetical protein